MKPSKHQKIFKCDFISVTGERLATHVLILRYLFYEKEDYDENKFFTS